MNVQAALRSTTCTRLLTLHPALGYAPITASLFIIELATTHPSYEAISYTWGDELDTCGITINGSLVRLRPNLHQCLIRLRSPSQPRTLWCDFLCISQTDVYEKNQQVQMIGEIFRSADRVLVWLGEHAEHSEELFRPWHGIKPENGLKCDPKHSFNEGESAFETAHNEHRATVWYEFFIRPYWTRTWIVQELRLARAIIVHCGPDVLDWQTLIGARFELEALEYLSLLQTYTRNDDDDLLWPLWASLRCIKRLGEPGTPAGKQWPHVQPCRDIFQIVGEFQGTLCSDPRDKVYALLTLEDRSPALKPIQVDYRQSLPQLVISLYETRYVYEGQPRFFEQVRAALRRYLGSPRSLTFQICPKADGIIESLDLSDVQCKEIAELAEQRMQTDGRAYSKRWRRVSREIDSALTKVVKQRLWQRKLRYEQDGFERFLKKDDGWRLWVGWLEWEARERERRKLLAQAHGQRQEQLRWS